MTDFVTKSQVSDAYFLILGREPDLVGAENFIGKVDLDQLSKDLKDSLENKINNQKMISGNYYQFNSNIDAIDIVLRHEVRNRRPVENKIVNFLGVIVDPSYFPVLLQGRQGTVESVPIPANWHADLAEFAAALRAVDLAKDSFRMVELGCGWGCWLMNTGVAARRKGLSVDLIGAEADAGHVEFARQACKDNEFTPEQAKILRKVVGAKPGTALFPRQEQAGGRWGLEPVFNATKQQIMEARANDTHDEVDVLTFEEICADGLMIDLVHMDIQGGEADFIGECIESMNKFVAYLVVGTHSRQIEGKIFEIMQLNGWVLEIERTALINLAILPPQTTVDGIQGWKNPRLRGSQ